MSFSLSRLLLVAVVHHTVHSTKVRVNFAQNYCTTDFPADEQEYRGLTVAVTTIAGGDGLISW